MAKLDMLLEMELGITGGEEDGVNNEVRTRQGEQGGRHLQST